MDIAGAKALKERLRSDEEPAPRPARTHVDVSAGALPVFQWLGLTPPNQQAPSIEGEDQAAVPGVALRSST